MRTALRVTTDLGRAPPTSSASMFTPARGHQSPVTSGRSMPRSTPSKALESRVIGRSCKTFKTATTAGPPQVCGGKLGQLPGQRRRAEIPELSDVRRIVNDGGPTLLAQTRGRLNECRFRCASGCADFRIGADLHRRHHIAL